MATADKVLSILSLFTVEQPEWTVEAVAVRLSLSGSTAYQYVRSLVDAGLLVSQRGGRYTIGPAVIELDRLMRRFDPLIHAARSVLPGLVAATGGDVTGLLCRIYRLRVMCVDQYGAGIDDEAISYERGRPMPLARGAASKAILAQLTGRQLRRFYDADADEIAAAGLGSDWEAFKGHIRWLRSQKVVMTEGELDEGMMGISAPVFDGDELVLGSVGLVVKAAPFRADKDRLATARQAVSEAGEAITRAIAAT
ncbi:DNA-binding IclR family transcriptional regulator [Sphingomonas sp. BE138]|uniref:IclR family transcriptional regulator n=1 Tax=Sphingomonas sp. BE138 TaxID=2817845 RepID=UPI002865E31E|nr:IclR family transcriptional regulator C-terminal domain-containing protein [Sphingomonas sp. BE138]MDR6787942.1 DNA-binding IclR family transcriptional regulator [Sphingomonas sp. BE138]